MISLAQAMMKYLMTKSIWMCACLIFASFALLYPVTTHAGIIDSLLKSMDNAGKPDKTENMAKTGSDGKVILKFEKPKDKKFNIIKKYAEDSSELKESVDLINDTFILPRNLVVNFEENEEGPYYDVGSSVIVMNYDFIEYLSDRYAKKYPDAPKNSKYQFTIGNTIFFLYHEIAHAFIDIYRIPIVSNEETAADNLSVILALEYREDGYDIVMNSAELFDMFDQDNARYDEDELWDEHSLDSQRFYNIVCLTYGRYPQKVKAEAKENKNKTMLKFIERRGDYCEAEYKRQLANWSALLGGHIK